VEDINSMLNTEDKMTINKVDLEKKLLEVENKLFRMEKKLVEMEEKFNLQNSPINMRDKIQKRGIEKSTYQIYMDNTMTYIVDMFSENTNVSKSNLMTILFKRFAAEVLLEDYNIKKDLYIETILKNANKYEDMINSLNDRTFTIQFKGVKKEINFQNGPYSGEDSGKKITATIEQSIKSKIEEVLNSSGVKSNLMGQLLLKSFLIENGNLISIAVKNEITDEDRKFLNTIKENLSKQETKYSYELSNQ
jgi:hypothetical protein